MKECCCFTEGEVRFLKNKCQSHHKYIYKTRVLKRLKSLKTNVPLIVENNDADIEESFLKVIQEYIDTLINKEYAVKTNNFKKIVEPLIQYDNAFYKKIKNTKAQKDLDTCSYALKKFERDAYSPEITEIFNDLKDKGSATFQVLHENISKNKPYESKVNTKTKIESLKILKKFDLVKANTTTLKGHLVFIRLVKEGCLSTGLNKSTKGGVIKDAKTKTK